MLTKNKYLNAKTPLNSHITFSISFIHINLYICYTIILDLCYNKPYCIIHIVLLHLCTVVRGLIQCITIRKQLQDKLYHFWTDLQDTTKTD